MRKEEKFGRQYCIGAVEQILRSRRRAKKDLSADECGKLADIMAYSGKNTKVSGMTAAHILEKFRGEFAPLNSQKQPSAPRRLGLSDDLLS